MQETNVTAPVAGTVLDTPQDLASAVQLVSEHPGAVEITLGADRPVGLHLGTVVRRQAGDQLRKAGAEQTNVIGAMAA